MSRSRSPTKRARRCATSAVFTSSFSIHSHGYGALITHLDGFPVPQPYQRDIITVAPGERTDVMITVREGIYPWHDHALENVLNNGEYLGGATFLVIGKK